VGLAALFARPHAGLGRRPGRGRQDELHGLLVPEVFQDPDQKWREMNRQQTVEPKCEDK
jgi:hypothetical protein